jgi:hypothetical protein
MMRRTQTKRQVAELEALYRNHFPAFARVAIDSSVGSFPAELMHRSALAQLETMGVEIRRAT